MTINDSKEKYWHHRIKKNVISLKKSFFKEKRIFMKYLCFEKIKISRTFLLIARNKNDVSALMIRV